MEVNTAESQALFKATFMAFVASGMPANEAAARTIEEMTRRAQDGAATTAQEGMQVEEEQSIADASETAAGTNELAPSAIQDVEMNEPVQVEDVVIEDTSMVPAPEDASPHGIALDASVQAPNAVPAEPRDEVPLGTRLLTALRGMRREEDLREVRKLVYQVFSDVQVLNAAFVCNSSSESAQAGDGADAKWWGIDSREVVEVFALLVGHSSEDGALQNTMRNALDVLVTQPWNVCSTWIHPEQLRFFLILFEHPLLFDPDYVVITGGLCKLFYHLSDPAKELLREQWSTHFSNDELYRMLQVLQQTITVSVYGNRPMNLVFACCAVMQELHEIDVARDPRFAAFEDYYNDAVNSEVDIVMDYTQSLFYLKKKRDAITSMGDVPEAIPRRLLSELSFCDFPFILDAASKSRILHIDSDLEQRTHFHDAVMSRALAGPVSPYLVVRIRRDNIVEDCLQQLAHVPPESLKKPLKVKFVGEDGIDEGGVRKEFFQILLRELLDPAFGMFVYDDETRMMWFNSDSLEATMEFELIGTLLGLAIYNAVILDLHFVHVVYKKLMNCSLGLRDVEVAMPALGKGLRQLLEFDGNVEEVFQRNFEYSYEVFGSVKTIELKPGGSAIAVTNANREEYVALYVDYILRTSVERQYNAFHKGFHLVCNDEVLRIFRWEELQLLVCGSEELDFEALEQATHYEDGFTEDSPTIRNFWSVVHELGEDAKKKLLKFATGSDRVPIRGLSNMTFVISRNGPDSDRLPSAHTCFNHLLLPDYDSREKLKERLLLAITNAEGFGLR